MATRAFCGLGNRELVRSNSTGHSYWLSTSNNKPMLEIIRPDKEKEKSRLSGKAGFGEVLMISDRTNSALQEGYNLYCAVNQILSVSEYRSLSELKWAPLACTENFLLNA